MTNAWRMTSATLGSTNAPLKPNPGLSESPPLAGSTSLRPNDVNLNSLRSPVRSPPDTSTPSWNRSLVCDRNDLHFDQNLGSPHVELLDDVFVHPMNFVRRDKDQTIRSNID